MPRKPNDDPLESPEALDNLAASYRTMAKTVATQSHQGRMLRMAEKFEALAKQKRAEIEDKRKDWQAW